MKEKRELLLEGRVAVVTGAGRGIGRTIALELIDEGATVVLVARTGDELAETEKQIRARNGTSLAVQCDVSRAADVDHMVERALDAFGKVDVLVNNAGIQGPIGPFVENDEEAWLQNIQVNLMGPLRCMRRILPGMMASRAGKIMNIAGGGATSPRVNFSAYSTSKAALVRLTETVAEEVRPFNVQVNAIAPGAVNTRMLQEIIDAGANSGTELEGALSRQSRGGVSPHVAARLAVFLASDASGGITGKLISAPHDDWQGWDESDLRQLQEKSWLTLRRLDPHTISQIATEPFGRKVEAIKK